MHCIGDEASLQSRTAACLLSRSFLWSRLQGKGQWNISLHLILTVVILLNLWPTAQPSIELFSEGDSGSWHTLTPPPLLKDVLRNHKTNNHNPDKQSNLLGYLSSHNVDTRQLGALLCNHGLEPSPCAGPWLLGCRRVVFVAIWVRTLVRVGRRNACYLKHPRVSCRVCQTGSSWRLELLREAAFCRTSGFHPNDFGMSVITEHPENLKVSGSRLSVFRLAGLALHWEMGWVLLDLYRRSNCVPNGGLAPTVLPTRSNTHHYSSSDIICWWCSLSAL